MENEDSSIENDDFRRLFGQHGPFEALHYPSFCGHLCAKPGEARQIGELSGDSFEVVADEISAVEISNSNPNLLPRGGSSLKEPARATSPRIDRNLSPSGARRVGKDPAWRRSAEELVLKEQRDQQRASVVRAQYLEQAAAAAGRHTKRVESVTARHSHQHKTVAAADRRLEKHREQEAAAERALMRVRVSQVSCFADLSIAGMFY